MEDIRFSILVLTAMIPVMNPVGTSVLLFGLTGSQPRKIHNAMSLKICIYCFVMLAVFYLIGHGVLALFGVSVPIVEISGGIVLCLMGWDLLNKAAPTVPASSVSQKELEGIHENNWLYPYSFPISVDPGALAVAMTLGAHGKSAHAFSTFNHYIFGLIGILLSCIVYYICLVYLRVVTEKLKTQTLMAISKILAFFVVCIGAQITWNGIKELFHL